MVNSISGVRFCGDVDSILSRPGKFSNPAGANETKAPSQSPAQAPAQAAGEEKKSSGAGKKVAGTIVTLAVIAAALVALPKVFPNAIKALSEAELKDAKWTQKIGHYVAEVGNAIGKYTYEPIAKLFSKNKGAANANADSKFFA